MNPSDYAYDVETPVNCFTMVLEHIESGMRWIYEISDWQNQAFDLVQMIFQLRATGCRMVGFNNLHFDYPVIHYIVETYQNQGFITPQQIHAKAMAIFAASAMNDKFAHTVKPWKILVPQLDLFTIHHFDNRSKTTSLKALEFNMRSPLVLDLPFDPNEPVGPEMVPVIIRYNAHDVSETIRFYKYTWPMIAFREELTAKHGRDFTNFNDTKIGKDIFINALEKVMPGSCYTSDRKPRQTWRHSIPLGSVIFPYIRFHGPEFNRVLAYLKATTIHNTFDAPELKDVTATIDGFDFVFGLGGIHGSVSNTTVRDDADHMIIDIDVKSYYPRIAIANRVYPEHLSETFCDIYRELYDQRQTYPKKSSESAMLKLALNGVYGDSNNVYGPFYDPAYTMTITVNGQLLLCMLAESLLSVPDFRIIQINTDGMTIRLPRSMRPILDQICKDWEALTLMELEYAEYRAMFIRDVNNYIAVGIDGKVKRKGAYQHDTSEPNNIAVSLGWAQDWSALVVQKAVEAACVKGADPVDFINRHDDAFDFMIRAKATGQSRLVATHPAQCQTMFSDPVPEWDEPLQKTLRFHIATTGPYLFKIMPPLPKKPDTERRISVEKGWPINVCNVATDFDWHRLDRRYYIEHAIKLLKVLQ